MFQAQSKHRHFPNPPLSSTIPCPNPPPSPTIPCNLTKLSFLAAKRERCQKKMTQNNITGTTNDN